MGKMNARRSLCRAAAAALALLAAAALPADEDKEKAALLSTDAAFSKMSEEKGALAAFLAYADEGVTMLPAGANPETGKDGVRRVFDGMPAGASLVWKPVTAVIAKAGDLGYTIGNYEARGSGADGKPMVRYGKYVSIWKRQPDRSWKFVVDIGNASPAPDGK
jgi:ketosteroid isomerase-like protein